MIYSFGINLNSLQWQSMGITDKSQRHLGISTDLGIDANSIPYPEDRNPIDICIDSYVMIEACFFESQIYVNLQDSLRIARIDGDPSGSMGIHSDSQGSVGILEGFVNICMGLWRFRGICGD